MKHIGSPSLHCPRCGRGELVDISFDADPQSDATADPGVPEQGADTRQVESYSCGHQVLGARLSEADPHHLDVERRTSDDTVAPVDGAMADRVSSSGPGSRTSRGRSAGSTSGVKDQAPAAR